MTTKILTPMETSLLDTVIQMQSEHMQERSHFNLQIAELRQDVAHLRSMIDQLAGQQEWQTDILTGLRPLLGLSLPQKP